MKQLRRIAFVLMACMIFFAGISANTMQAEAAPKTKTYKITYKLNGGKNHRSNAKRIRKGKSLKLKNPTRTGYKFKGWYKDKACRKRITKVCGRKNQTVYAKWQKLKTTPAKTHVHRDYYGNDLGKVPWCGICNGTGINSAPLNDPENPDGSKNIYPL